jgi:serine/threonine-protein kinase
LLNFGEKIQKRFKQEIEILKNIQHEHIVRYIDSGKIKGMENSQNRNEVCIHFLIMEKADKNIVDYMRFDNDSIDYEVYAPQFRGLAAALQCLHAIAIHRDIKPENILVKGETWLLSDFGLCEMIDEAQRLDVTKDTEKIGPKFWLSPEALDRIYFGQAEIDEASDVYQMCAVFWFIITRRYPIGVIDEQDYTHYDKSICHHILAALKYNKGNRIHDGRELYISICEATINSEGKR